MHDHLSDAVQLVRSRIESDGDYISGHETRTRQFLIDPVLTALGWSVLDPAVVILEAKVHNGFADYLCVRQSASVFVVEAKRLGTNMDSQPVDQVYVYANWLGLERAVITDGNVWRFLEVTGMGASKMALLAEVRCNHGDASDTVGELVEASQLLSRPSTTLE